MRQILFVYFNCKPIDYRKQQRTQNNAFAVDTHLCCYLSVNVLKKALERLFAVLLVQLLVYSVCVGERWRGNEKRLATRQRNKGDCW